MRAGTSIVGVALLLCTAVGCTMSQPEIVELYWQVNHRLDVDTGDAREELVFFAHARDADGDDDIESLYLVHDGAELYWRLEPDTWERRDIDEEGWIGHSAMTSYRYDPFPRGAYRVILFDLAGQRAESSMYVSADRRDPQNTSYPTLEIDEQEVRIQSTYERNTLWFYDGSGEVVKLVSTTEKVVPLADALSNQERERAVGAAVYAFDDRYGIGVISGRYDLR